MRYPVKIEIMDDGFSVIATISNEDNSDIPQVTIDSFFTDDQWVEISNKILSAVTFIRNNG